MKRHRFIGDFDFREDRITLLDPGVLSQIRNVLRFKPGDEIILTDYGGREAVAKILALGKSSAELEILERRENRNEPNVRGVLYCAILKKEHFELVAEKATEIGIAEIVPVITRRTVKLNLNQDRLRKIIKEAAEQSGRGRIPVLHDPVSFGGALEHASGNDLNIIFSTIAEASGWREIESENKKLGVFVGPEGGWDEEELLLAKDRKFLEANLGPLTLRAETAAIVASYLVLHS